MKLIKEKKSSALEEIYDRYIKLIYGFTFKFMNGNEESTKEVVQLVFLRLWTTKSGYDSEKGSFVNWILTINRNICIDYIRKERIHREKQINMMNPSLRNPPRCQMRLQPACFRMSCLLQKAGSVPPSIG
nr:sigma-70 family RNA polymerase sigma factor [Bhargavaea beijingensis]